MPSVLDVLRVLEKARLHRLPTERFLRMYVEEGWPIAHWRPAGFDP